MQMKGYSYTQETQRQVGLEAVKGGIIKEGSGGVGGGLGSGIAGLGVELAAVGAVMGLTKDAIAPLSQTTTEIGQSFGGLVKPTDATNPNLWDCDCGEKGITKNFCSNCGEKKPAPKETWDCSCGEKSIVKNFCPDCGTKRPAPPEKWNCTCGETDNIKKFCANCGAQKPITTTWDCECGNKAIAKKFCDECGKKREDEPGGA
jgi:membrane protease subunit (stomatin/prohibitin family)